MADRYWNPAANANWADANVWATTFNGDPTGVATPTSADDVFFSNTNSRTCTIAAAANCKSLDFTYGTGFIGTFAGTSYKIEISGSATLSSGMTFSFSNSFNLIGSTGTLISAGKSITNAYFVGNGGDYDISGALTCTSLVIGGSSISSTVTSDNTISCGYFSLLYGTFNQGGSLTCSNSFSIAGNGTSVFNANTFNVTAPGFPLSVANNLTVNMGSGTWTATGTSPWLAGATLTLNAESSTIKITDSSNSDINFQGYGKIYNNVWFNRGTSTGTITFTGSAITGSNTFKDLKDDGTAAHSLIFRYGSTTTVETFTVSGTAGNLITLNSSTTATYNFVKTGGGIISCDYLNIQHSVATPDITWLATNSVNNQGDETAGSGWYFGAFPLIAGVGTFTLTGIDAILTKGLNMAASVGAFALTGKDVLFEWLQHTYEIVCSTGEFALTGIDTIITSARSIIASVGAFTLTGINNILTRGYTIATSVGVFVLTGKDVLFEWLSHIYTMTVSVGAFALTGIDTTITSARSMIATVGAFTLTGIDIAFEWLQHIFEMAVGVGQFILTGIDIAFRGMGSWKMKNQAKHSAGTITNQVKHSISPTNQTKHTITPKNQPKS